MTGTVESVESAENKYCQNAKDCVIVNSKKKTIDLLQKRIDERDAILGEIAPIIGLPKDTLILDIPEKLKEFLETRGDKAKIVAENKRLIKENQELAYEIYTLNKK